MNKISEKKSRLAVNTLHTKTPENYNFPFYTVIGCPHPVPPRHAWVQRRGDRAVVKCNHTIETFYLTCRNHRWVGTVSNCTKGKKSLPF